MACGAVDWERLVDQQENRLYRAALAILGSVPEAEDAVQETFLKVFRYFDDYRHKGRFRAFLYKVAGNTCIDMMRKKQWDPIPEDAAQEESGMRKTEEQEDFLRIIRKLPPELGEVVFLRFSQELRLREIAETVGIPLRTVQSRLRRALELLRTEMEREGEAEEEGNRSNEIEIRKGGRAE